MSDLPPVRVRFAPSPTGYLHIGGARTALYNYLLAKQTGGQFILRIEDTDRERFVESAEQDLKDGLRWLGLQWDEGPEVGGPVAPYVQSERVAQHREHAEKLIELGRAYHCFCSRERLKKVRREQNRYDGHCRHLDAEAVKSRLTAGESSVVRFDAPREGKTTVQDYLRGEITVNNSTIDDFVLLKSDGMALYHLAAMVDDHAMGITHVMRSEEWLPSLPRHALIYRAFGWDEPVWCHLSVFKKPSGKGKMSKRESAELRETEGHSIFVRELRELGYLPEAIVNWIALMGWSFDDRTDDFTLAELIEKFSLGKLNPAPAAVDFARLDHFQGKYVRQLSTEAIVIGVRPFLEATDLTVDDELLRKAIPLIRERLITFEDAPDWIGFLFRDQVELAFEDLIAKKLTARETLNAVRRARVVLEGVSVFDHDTTHSALRTLAEELGLKAGQLFGPIRMAVTGQRVSPPLFESMEIVGRETVLARLALAEKILEGDE